MCLDNLIFPTSLRHSSHGFARAFALPTLGKQVLYKRNINSYDFWCLSLKTSGVTLLLNVEHTISWDYEYLIDFKELNHKQGLLTSNGTYSQFFIACFTLSCFHCTSNSQWANVNFIVVSSPRSYRILDAAFKPRQSTPWSWALLVTGCRADDLLRKKRINAMNRAGNHIKSNVVHHRWWRKVNLNSALFTLPFRSLWVNWRLHHSLVFHVNWFIEYRRYCRLARDCDVMKTSMRNFKRRLCK